MQHVFLEHARLLGFSDESKGLFAGYADERASSRLPPAARRHWSAHRGRAGQDHDQQHGSLDFWKCHICEHADYLFLLVPTELRQNETMSPRREFATVRKRLSSFFEEGNYTNVRGLFLFGY